MALPTFFRLNFSEIWIRLTSNEALGILDSDYIEDYSGNDGQLTIRNRETNRTYSLLMSGLPNATPAIDNDVFIGTYPLSGLPNGTYEIMGRVRDLGGNYVVFTDFHAPTPDARIFPYLFAIADGVDKNVNIGQGSIKKAFTYDVAIGTPRQQTVDIEINGGYTFSTGKGTSKAYQLGGKMAGKSTSGRMTMAKKAIEVEEGT